MLAALPLVIPSYVGGLVLVAALGPRGMLQGALQPLGVERLPEIYGLPGAALALTLFTYPYVYLTVRGALRGMDPAMGRSVARARDRGVDDLLPGNIAAAQARHRRRGAARRALHPERLWSGLTPAIRLVCKGNLRSVPLGLRPDPCRHPGP